MSDPTTKAARSKAKDARQEPAPDVKPRHVSKKAKPWRVDCKWIKPDGIMARLGFGRGWRKFGMYRTEKEALTAIKNDKRKCAWYEYKVTKVK